MIYDRPYMQDDFRPRQKPVLKWILLTTIGIWILQEVFAVWFKQTPALSRFFLEFFALSTANLQTGFVWTIVTYAFLHGGFWHILINLLFVYFFGRELVPLLGAKRFTQFYLFAAAVGGLAWLLIEVLVPSGIPVIGASASAVAIVTLFAGIYPNKQITIFLYFVIPVRIKPKYLAYVILAFSLFGLLFFELPQTPTGDGTQVAHSAHLGGMLAAWLYFQYVFGKPERVRTQPAVEPPSWLRRKTGTKKKAAGNFSVNISNRKVLKEEVDRILDKINSQGFGALSEEEKKLLDRAKDLLSK